MHWQPPDYCRSKRFCCKLFGCFTQVKLYIAMSHNLTPKKVAKAYSTTNKIPYVPQCSCFYFLKVIESACIRYFSIPVFFACTTLLRSEYHHRLHISCWFLWDQKASRSQRNGQSLRVVGWFFRESKQWWIGWFAEKIIGIFREFAM